MIIQGFWLSYSLYDKFNLYSSDQSLCPLCLCGSFHSLPQDCILDYILPTKPKRAKNPPLWGEGEKPTQD
ncbi:hypothetical protein MTo_00854 [Microcystis aeruginosa NIES-1211]|uniref:Uncharacterized protein n=1 Tax=Microcystis aeruginosa NIES-2519 TaxID=2303981 RepID=A0A5A5R305_MICAE|nr:hypothetical protein B5D77_03390 [Microcystis sp. MC19]CCI32063.1 hypothetical protein MICAI_2300014 [Microcystis sp. T1-4]GBL13563.1 hypothetical protein MTo_00854 [Microcystis aeruginosa NIES-1211]GCA70433.1 hypothetical protein MiYa_01965 [Microcystis aeruginosa NIES-2519]GCA83086.1 hypothetical protein MiHa_01044 [Microcystis aeruginosa NIES-2522]GCA88666.1 hypothetical protein MiTa_02013 [Microcystis aeruginosa NIES-4264]